MPGEAFTAGVEPGGLIDPTQIKILVCYLLREAAQPMLKDDILAAVSAQGDANYFEMADALSELQRLGHVIDDDEWYTLAPSGEDIVRQLEGDVALTVRERTSASAKELARRRRSEQNNRVTITDSAAGGCTVRCAVCERSGQELLCVTLEVPSRKEALQVRDRFIDNAEEVLRANYELLLGASL